MTEKQWVKSFIPQLQSEIQSSGYEGISVESGKKLPYSSEILSYENDEPAKPNVIKYETDILIYELVTIETWKPRIIIEAKYKSITTHDAITYSQKSQAHKFVHPYLRYGILIGHRKHFPLPGRLFRHGLNFDFMQSWIDDKPKNEEWDTFLSIIKSEINASRQLEEIIFNSRSKSRKHFTALHKPLKLSES